MIGRRALLKGAAMVAPGLGRSTPSRFPYKGRPQQPGVGAPSQGQTIRARRIIVSGEGDGVFVYSGVPALGNPPIIYISAASADPFGNPVTPNSVTDNPVPGVIAQLLNGQLYLSGQDPGPNTLATISAGLEELALAAPMTNATDVQGFLLLSTALTGNLPQHQINGVLNGTEPGTSNIAAWHAITVDSAWTGGVPTDRATPSYRMLADGRLDLTGCYSFGSSQTQDRKLNSANPLPAAYIPATDKTVFTYDGQLTRATAVLFGQSSPTPGVIEAFGSATFPWEFCEISATVPLNI